MAVRLDDVAAALRQGGLRHHVDADQGVIRVIFVTETYRNLRDERLAIVTLSTPEEGRIVRGTIERAFAAGDDASQVCARLCRMAADTPLVGVEYDRDGDNLRLVVESCVEDARPTSRQVLSMIGRLVEAADVWFAAGGLKDASFLLESERQQDAA
jgi:hypothetical protein